VNEFCHKSGLSICKYETKKVVRGLGQFNIKQLDQIDFTEKLYLISFKDLTVEEEIVKSFQYQVSNMNKKITEMSQLVDIFQKIRLLDNPSLILNEFINYLSSSSEFYASLSRINGKMESLRLSSSILNINPDLVALEDEVESVLSQVKVTKYHTYKSKIISEKKENYYWSVAPFKLANDEMHTVFTFDSVEQMNQFSHQSAIILNEQLNLVLNNLTLKELSYTDGLTLLKNNLYFRTKLDEDCLSYSRAQLILVDVDYFKKINDTYGHPGGDAVLIFLGEVLPNVMARVNPDDQNTTFARVGGEEFAILMPQHQLEMAELFAEELRKEVEATSVTFNESRIQFTISLGISSWKLTSNSTKDTIKDLYKAADDALYNSKRTGRNKVTTAKAS
jgi:diguanylate cyclase (GGDEF)-like protein